MPTGRGCLLLILLIASLLYGTTIGLYPFLAQHHPVANAEIIIIEGWLGDVELKEVAKAIRPGQIVVTTGGPLGYGQKILQYDNYAELATARLIDMGIPAGTIITVPSPDTQHDRTYLSAQITRCKLEELGLFGKSANLYTIGAHARRSYLLFHHVFGKDYPLGIIAISPPDYHLEHWYRYSEGVKHVLTEFIAWIYVQFFLMTHHA